MDMFDDFFIDVDPGWKIYEEIEKLQEECINLDDESLVDEVSMMITTYDFDLNVDKIVTQFFSTGKLKKEGRKCLEGCYILFHGDWAIREDGELMLTKKI